MPASVTVLGIRHHGPGSARMLVRALDALKPDAVLIEGPPDAAELVPLVANAGLKPPVALLVYEPNQPRESVYYPFAEFSPEWQAMRWGVNSKVEVRFMDLPQSLRPRREKPEPDGVGPDGAHKGESEADNAAEPDQSGNTDEHDDAESTLRADPLDALARAAGFSDGEAWWGRLIEERRGGDQPLEVFAAIHDAMAAARAELSPPATHVTPDAVMESAREAHMRRSIRAAIKEGFSTIAVICGAWHAPVLTADALKAHPAKADDETLKTLTKRKTAATWIPWTYDRLSMFSGYGAGIVSPGWYEHLWVHHDNLTERWMTKVARLLREADLEASPASAVESVRLAEALASMRGRHVAGLEELGEASLSILCHGNPMPMRIIGEKLIVGSRLGEVPADAPMVPLQRDLAAQQKSLRLKVSADDTILDLDQRKEMDLARSRLLHRLRLLDIGWGTQPPDQKQRSSTFHEVWKLQWKPEFAVDVMEAARWGNTVEEAAGAFVTDRAAHASSLAELTAMLDHVMLADLPDAVERLIHRIQDMSAVSADFGHLLEAFPPLVRVLRYGNVRKTDAAMVEPVVDGMLARIAAGLLPACGSLDDEAAAQMRDRLDAVEASLATLERQGLLDTWREAVRKVADAAVHGLLAGRCTRILLDAGTATPDDAATRMSLSLSAGNDPGAAAAWLEGFLGGSGLLLVHDVRLLAMIDHWVCGLSRDLFDRVCPIVRRTFSDYAKSDRRMIGEKLKSLDGSGDAAPTAGVATDDYVPARGDLVLPILRTILGELP
ncbi:MAG TPA: DUF5682 family protein [Phycisphaerales bacterium]|nr:DUF5682 family protein [Phycisphaerales bacterium]